MIMKFKIPFLIVFTITLPCFNISFSQIKFTENFNYSAGDSIGAHGWIWNSGTVNTVFVTSPGLYYSGYPFSGIGNAASLSNTGNDQYKNFSSADSTGSFYAAFMVIIDSAKVQGDYFLAFLPDNSITFYEGRVSARFQNGNLNFGITKGNASTDTSVSGIWTTGSYSLGTTYLLVLKYTFVPASNTNDQVSLFVFNSGLPSSEPTPAVGPLTYSSLDAENIGRIALRQGTSTRAPKLRIDGIRAASSWKALTDSVEITSLYALGSIPENFGCPDTLGIRLSKTVPGSYDINLSIKVQKIDSPFIVKDSTVIIVSNSGIFDTLIYYEIPCQTVIDRAIVFRRDRLIVEALPGNRSSDAFVFDSKEYCQYSTFDAYNYSDSCLQLDRGFGLDNSSGNIVAGFNNYSSQVFPINTIDYSFYYNSGNGNRPYKIVIYGNNGDGNPGTLLYISPELISPANTSYVTHSLSNPVTISPNSRFFVGIRQTSSANIGMSVQNEFPVRTKSFFYSSPDTSNTWKDFSTAGLNYRLYISPRKNIDLKLILFIEGFYNSFLNSMVSDTVKIYLRNSTSPFSIKDSSKSFISSNGTGTFYFSNADVNTFYYLSLRHRNSIETWSSQTVLFSEASLSYNFSSSANQSYGNNMIKVDAAPLRYAVYSGDVNQDGIVDLADGGLIDNDSYNFLSGYLPTDINGDQTIDIADASIADNNSFNYVSKVTP